MTIRLIAPSPQTAPADHGDASNPGFPYSIADLVPDPNVPHPERSPPAARFSSLQMNILGERPGDELEAEEAGRGLLKCRTCGKTVLESAVALHAANCAEATKLENAIAMKKIAGGSKRGTKRRNSDVSATASDDSTVFSAATPNKRSKQSKPTRADSYTSTAMDLGGANGSEAGDAQGERLLLENGKTETKKQMMKRLAQERREAKPSESTKESPTSKDAKKKAKEYHPDRCCGVLITEGAMAGSQCSRKLDCKIHTVGSKREVEGRSMSFDDCLRNMRVEAGQPVSKPWRTKSGDDKVKDSLEATLTPTAAAAVAALTPVKKKKPKKAAAAGGAAKASVPAGPIDGDVDDAAAAAAEFRDLVRVAQYKTARVEESIRATLLDLDLDTPVRGAVPPPLAGSIKQPPTRGLFGVWHLDQKRASYVTDGLLSDIVRNVSWDLDRRVKARAQGK